MVLTCVVGVGDPTDSSIMLRPLEPATGQALARDLVLKTRRRKGLGDQIAVSKYLDDEFVVRFRPSTVCLMMGADIKFLACIVCVGACGSLGLARIRVVVKLSSVFRLE